MTRAVDCRTIQSVQRKERHPPLSEREEMAARLSAACAYRYVASADLAVACGVAKTTTITNWMRGKTAIPDDKIAPFAERCGVPVEFLRHGWPDPWFTPASRDVGPEAHTAAQAALEQRLAEVARLAIVEELGRLDPTSARAPRPEHTPAA